ncbi:serine hydrolase [Apilactobacillus apisilvae]|uniref:Serine hydrolase n=1 Tax=Apilactobacillus apisilvae TaxID=2923364 RepID=A0ABY4PFY0_9LACO|nr:serine hydrolase [Apilactobacillus apisilvae]UQS84411.1 serine hydrolase [Apilactobacillus apisilvae]
MKNKIISFSIAFLLVIVGLTFIEMKNPNSIANQIIKNNKSQKPHSSVIQFKNAPITNSKDLKLVGEPKSMVAIDADKGKILYSHNAKHLEEIASLSKLMTLYLVIKKAQKVNGWNQIVNTSDPRLKKMGDSYILGGFKFNDGHKYTVRDLYKAALIKSSNNSAIALGEWVAGTNVKFIKMMNEQANEWHLNSHFVSSSGLDNTDLKPYGYHDVGGSNAVNEVSAEDIGKIAVYILKEYPEIVNDSKQTESYVNDQTLYNENGLLKGKPFYDPSLYVDGLKTGYTENAGLCFVGTSKKTGKDRLVTVTLDDNNEFSNTSTLMKFIYKNSNLYKK